MKIDKYLYVLSVFTHPRKTAPIFYEIFALKFFRTIRASEINMPHRGIFCQQIKTPRSHHVSERFNPR